ncbi:MAG TPA: hypothetical protein ENK32_10375 [Anaerolineae bacterium]|nr:hypothetical protein [Anaerolineae bacterium]
MTDEQELPPISITEDDIKEANQLSLHCPICANPVEKFAEDPDLRPVVCTECGTLYHKACREQSGDKCAVLGCESETFYAYGMRADPVITIKHSDLKPGVNGRSPRPQRAAKRLKNEQRRQVEQLRRPGLLQRLFQWLLDQIKIG